MVEHRIATRLRKVVARKEIQRKMHEKFEEKYIKKEVVKC